MLKKSKIVQIIVVIMLCLSTSFTSNVTATTAVTKEKTHEGQYFNKVGYVVDDNVLRWTIKGYMPEMTGALTIIDWMPGGTELIQDSIRVDGQPLPIKGILPLAITPGELSLVIYDDEIRLRPFEITYETKIINHRQLVFTNLAQVVCSEDNESAKAEVDLRNPIPVPPSSTSSQVSSSTTSTKVTSSKTSTSKSSATSSKVSTSKSTATSSKASTSKPEVTSSKVSTSKATTSSKASASKTATSSKASTSKSATTSSKASTSKSAATSSKASTSKPEVTSSKASASKTATSSKVSASKPAVTSSKASTSKPAASSKTQQVIIKHKQNNKKINKQNKHKLPQTNEIHDLWLIVFGVVLISFAIYRFRKV